MNKIVCIDYDGSYTIFPELFNLIISFCKQKNIRVILATMRYRSEIDDSLESVMSKVDETYFTERMAKLPYLKKLGIEPNLWIDDRPDFLFNNSI